MTQIIENEITNLIEQSDDIARYVKNEDWETVAELSQKRQSNLENFFSSPINVNHAKAVEKMIRQILAIDHQLVDYIELEKKNTFNKFANLQNNNKANKTYLNVASLD